LNRPHTFGYWLRIVARRWPVVLGATAIGLALGLAYSATQPTLYEARSTLVISSATGFDPSNSRDLPAIAGTVAGLAETDAVLVDAGKAYAASGGDAAKERASTATIDWLRGRVSARVPTDTSLIEIAARNDTQAEAADLGLATANALIARLRTISGQSANALRVEAFGVPASRGQVSPKPVQNAVLGATAGLLMGLLIALLAGDRGLRARRPEELADALGVGEVLTLDTDAAPRVRSLDELFDGRLVVGAPKVGSDIDRLAARVTGAADRGATVIAVLGPVASEKLRSVSLALGTRLAASGRSTLVIDAAFHGGNGVAGSHPGLSEALGTDGVDAVIGNLSLASGTNGDAHSSDSYLALLPAGRREHGTDQLLSSPAFGELLRDLRGRYRHIVVAGPSAADQADSIAVAEQADANVIVLSQRLSIDHAREAMRSEEATVRPLVAVGVVPGS
jgi:Mrp family chromosome partitioning ATPase